MAPATVVYHSPRPMTCPRSLDRLRTRLLVPVLCALAASACDSEPPPPPPPAALETLAATWDTQTLSRPGLKLTPEGASEPLAGCDVALVSNLEDGQPELHYSCDRRDLVQDVLIEGVDDRSDEQRRRDGFVVQSIRGEILSRAGDTPLSGLTQSSAMVHLDLPITVKVRGYEPVSATIPPLSVGARVFSGLATNPLLFEGEASASDDGELTALVLREDVGSLTVLGQGQTLRDLDWIVVHDDQPTEREKQCGVAGLGKFVLVANDAKISVHARRTGEMVATHSIPHGQLDCGSVVTRSRGDTRLDSVVDHAEVIAWVRAQVERGG